jgi:tRNA(Ile)-lysidine synthase
MLEVVEKDLTASIENVGADPRAEAIYDADALGPTLTLRPAGPGDRMTVFGAQGSKKLSDLLQQHRIPTTARACWPVVCESGSVVWLVGIRRAEGARVGPRTRRVLHLRLRAPSN